MSFTSQRDLVVSQAGHNSKQAYCSALKISDYWYRTQALSWIARYADDSEFDKFIRQAIQAALKNLDVDPYKVVGSSAWIMRAAVERQQLNYIPVNLPNILNISSYIDNPVSRGDALFLLFQGIFPAQKFYQPTLENLLSACMSMNSWKKPLIIRDIALIIAKEDFPQAYSIADEISEGRVRRQTYRKLGQKKFASPRKFFW